MADTLGMDPARIARLRSKERLEYFDPALIWPVLNPAPDCTLIDIGAGTGYLALPFAARYPDARIYACDILEGMTALLREDAAARNLSNIETMTMAPNAVDLADNCADFVVMAQLHHELDEPDAMLAECRRLLRAGGTVAVIDWKNREGGKGPRIGRWVPEARIRAQLEGASFADIRHHDIYHRHSFLTGRV